MKKTILCLLTALLMLLPSCGEIADPLAPVSSEIPSSASSEAASSAISSPDDGDFLPMLSEEESRAQFGWSTDQLFYGEYFYYIGKVGNGSNTYMKKNVRTGECLPVCTDPACTHRAGSDCPFANLWVAASFNVRFSTDGKIAYIYEIEDNGAEAAPQKGHFRSYNTVTMENKELFSETASGFSGFNVAENGDIYFVYSLLQDVNDPLCETHDFYLKKYNPKTKENETVMIFGSGKSLRDKESPQFYTVDAAGRHWFVRTNLAAFTEEYYYLLPGDETEYCLTAVPRASRFFVAGDWCCYLQFDYNTVDEEGCRLYKKSISTGAETLLEEAVTTSILDGGDRCYFFRYDKEIHATLREHITNNLTEIPNTRCHQPVLYSVHYDTGELLEYPFNSKYVPEKFVLHRGRIYCNGIYLRDERIWGGTQSRFTVDLRSGNVRDGIPSDGTGETLFYY